ncbi:hypothetical protein CROQUDRAFT_110038 [Cronartium quercuum f. sp. fusiforme G11]|uniref:Uncharacterized protein n=1 Tax=Cronartium quercuum f. sp. fusiforme G11 TaxID=708437 RepID=A0A9P6NDQ9_9BASI|nr:hypothetical protein CROQUDRAFT_110038 [Cronartium quercuum f. sp. fusiforme G11]
MIKELGECRTLKSLRLEYWKAIVCGKHLAVWVDGQELGTDRSFVRRSRTFELTRKKRQSVLRSSTQVGEAHDWLWITKPSVSVRSSSEFHHELLRKRGTQCQSLIPLLGTSFGGQHLEILGVLGSTHRGTEAPEESPEQSELSFDRIIRFCMSPECRMARNRTLSRV